MRNNNKIKDKIAIRRCMRIIEYGGYTMEQAAEKLGLPVAVVTAYYEEYKQVIWIKKLFWGLWH